MKTPPVRITRCRTGGFYLWHWNKYIGWRADEASATAEAKERSDKLALTRSLKEMARQDRQRSARPAVPAEHVDTWREDGRDPNEPTRGWITHYLKNGGTKRGWEFIPPGHPFHWSHKYRVTQRVLDRRGLVIIPPSLPALSYQPLQSCHSSSLNTPDTITSPSVPSPDLPSAPDATATPPAAPSTAITPISASSESNPFADLPLFAP